MNRSKIVVLLATTVLTAGTMIVAPAWADSSNAEGAKANGDEQSKWSNVERIKGSERIKGGDQAKWSNIELK